MPLKGFLGFVDALRVRARAWNCLKPGPRSTETSEGQQLSFS